MKCIKHLTRSHSEEKKSALLNDLGLDGYGFFWRLCEIVAEQNGYQPVKQWRKQLGISRKKLRLYLCTLAEQGLIDFEQSGDDLAIEVPGLVVLDTDNRCDSAQWAALRDAVFLRDNYTCSYCESAGGRLECDHRIPVSRGGSDSLDNLTTSCFACNRAKRAKTDEEFITFRNRIEVVN